MGPLEAAAGVAGAGAERDLDLMGSASRPAAPPHRSKPTGGTSAWITVGFRVDVADDLADMGKNSLK